MPNLCQIGILAAQNFCHELDARVMQKIDVTAFKNPSITMGAVYDKPVALQRDLDEFIKPDGNTTQLS